MKHNPFKGTGVALVTPFKSDFSVDVEALKRIVYHVIDNGADFLVVLGTTSEAPTLTTEEKSMVINTILETNANRLPIMLGMGGNNTQAVIEAIKAQNYVGIDGILSVVPYYNKPNQHGMKAHFEAIADASPVPVVVYNVPGRVGVNLQAATCLELAKHPNIIAVKEASGNLQQIMEILRDAPTDFDVLSGDDAITMPLMALGATGVISVAANAYPSIFRRMMTCMGNESTELARFLHYDMLRMNQLIFADGNPTGIKCLMSHIGLCENVLRLPLVKANEKVENDIIEEWKALTYLFPECAILKDTDSNKTLKSMLRSQ
ncbi:MAG: 4-hydroxy-tetrahydrodipicolinate synthase [Bacteroidales bacterium]|nr:4-hydroxy-tetrahydrodipicolinate synthase [Bacteroidales bacterium]